MTASPKPTAILLLHCRDQKGLVASVSDFLYKNGGNIRHADQHTDMEKGVFLQRVEWELENFKIPRPELEGAFKPLAEKFGMAWKIHFSDEKARAAVLVTKEAHCLYDLLARWRLGEFRAELPLVVSNHDDLRSVAEGAGLEYLHIPMEPGAKAGQEKKLLDEFRKRGIDLVILARYMQVLGPDLVGAYQGRMINIHHSFLPAFSGARPYHQAHQRGVKVIGATAHYVTDDLDQGPIIDQDVARVSHRDAVEDLIRKGRDLEKIVLARAVGLHLARRVIVYGNKTVVFD
jgi:formyltetrahydrofolate deformylase